MELGKRRKVSHFTPRSSNFLNHLATPLYLSYGGSTAAGIPYVGPGVDRLCSWQGYYLWVRANVRVWVRSTIQSNTAFTHCHGKSCILRAAYPWLHSHQSISSHIHTHVWNRETSWTPNCRISFNTCLHSFTSCRRRCATRFLTGKLRTVVQLDAARTFGSGFGCMYAHVYNLTIMKHTFGCTLAQT